MTDPHGLQAIPDAVGLIPILGISGTCSILEQGLDLLLQSERFRIGSSQFIKRWQDAEHHACMITEPLEEMMGDSSLRVLVQFEVQQSRAQLYRMTRT